LIPKTAPGRNPEYLDYIRRQECYVCQQKPCEPHHAGGGVGRKGSDYSCVPLCRKHHRELHDIGKSTFMKQYEIRLSEAVEKYLVPWCDMNGG
jgi:hypothetical protein